MAAVTAPGSPRGARPDIEASSLPKTFTPVAAAVSATVGLLSGFVIGGGGVTDTNPFAVLAIGGGVYIGVTAISAIVVEGRRRATNRIVTAFIASTFLAVLVPLGSVLWTVVERGSERFGWSFLTQEQGTVLDNLDGAKHAIYGTLMMTGIAAAISIPLGIMVAIYLVEYGRGILARAVTTLVDVMTGIPSIVAGLFAYSLFVRFDQPGHRSGLAGGVALAVLMTPVVVRTSEEMLRLVPNELREAAYGLGVPKWKTIVKIVIPTAISGILTGVTLAIARVIGETAPLLLVAGTTPFVNTDPFNGRMESLPIMAYYGYKLPGVPPEEGYARGWAASLTLVLIVAVLFFLARILSKVLQPKGLR